MKKILSIFASLGLTVVASSAAISCTNIATINSKDVEVKDGTLTFDSEIMFDKDILLSSKDSDADISPNRPYGFTEVNKPKYDSKYLQSGEVTFKLDQKLDDKYYVKSYQNKGQFNLSGNMQLKVKVTINNVKNLPEKGSKTYYLVSLNADGNKVFKMINKVNVSVNN